MPATLPNRAQRKPLEARSRLLHSWAADRYVLTPATARTGQALTFTRASVGTVFDSNGLLYTPNHSQPRFQLGTGSAAYDTLGLVNEIGSTNLCLQAENLGTTWAQVGTPTLVAAGKLCGDVSLYYINDNDGAVLEGVSQTVTFTANAVKAISVFFAQGTSTTSALRLRDTTAGADRLLAVLTWSAGVPTWTMTTGTFIVTETLGNGCFRSYFQTTSVTAANTNSLQFYPATTSALAVATQGDCYVGGFQAENATHPTSYVKTTTGTVARSADLLSSTADWLHQDVTFYAKILRPTWAALSGAAINNGALLSIGNSVTNSCLLVYLDSTSRLLVGLAVDSAAASASQNVAIPAGTTIEICAQFVNVLSAVKVRLDVGSGFAAFGSAAAALQSTIPGNVLTVGSASYAVGSNANCPVVATKIAAGALTLAQMRAAA